MRRFLLKRTGNEINPLTGVSLLGHRVSTYKPGGLRVLHVLSMNTTLLMK